MADTPIYLFAGDSLTEGTHGESYVARLGGRLAPGHVLNAGRGADTLKALHDRIHEPLEQHRPDWVVLAIGLNDVWLPWLASHSPVWQMWLQLRRWRLGQQPTTDLDRFAALYRSLIEQVSRHAGARVLVCTTSCCGERLSTPPNQQLAGLNGVIKRVAADCQVPVADVWQAFVDELAPLGLPSAYIPGEWLFGWLDRRQLQSTAPDVLSGRRRLHLTFDGIHLNSRGADLWAATIGRALMGAPTT